MDESAVSDLAADLKSWSQEGLNEAFSALPSSGREKLAEALEDAEGSVVEEAPAVLTYVEVVTLGGSALSICVEDGDTLENLVQKVAEVISEDIMDIRLLCNGAELVNRKASLEELGAVNGVVIFMAVSRSGIVRRMLSVDSPGKSLFIHQDINPMMNGMKLFLDDEHSRLYFADYFVNEVGFIDLTNLLDDEILATLKQEVSAVALHDGTLYAATLGSESGDNHDGQLVKIPLETNSAEVLLDNLIYPSAIAISSTGEVFFTEIGRNGSLCKLKGNEKKTLLDLNSVPTSLIIIDEDAGVLAFGAMGDQSPGTKGSVSVVSLSNLTTKMLITDLSSNTDLAMDFDGCLYCAGKSDGCLPGLEAFPGFKEAAVKAVTGGAPQMPLPSRLDIDEDDYTNVESIALDGHGRRIFYYATYFSSGRAGNIGLRQINLVCQGIREAGDVVSEITETELTFDFAEVTGTKEAGDVESEVTETELTCSLAEVTDIAETSANLAVDRV